MSRTLSPSPTDAVLDRLFEERIVYLAGVVDDEAAHRITAQLLLLTADDPARDITFYVNSPGGSVTAGMAIYDTMQLVGPDVATWAVGLAGSMGQFLLSAGAPGKRYALPHARILMHQPSASLGGTATIRVRAADRTDAGRTRRARIGHRDEARDRGADRPAHRADGGDGDRRRRPRPLVHRGAGAGVRAGRPRGRTNRTDGIEPAYRFPRRGPGEFGRVTSQDRGTSRRFRRSS